VREEIGEREVLLSSEE